MVNNTIEMIVTKEKAKQILAQDLYDLLYKAHKVRKGNFGRRVHFCSIVNAKSGKCSEDCKFCSQSAHHNTSIPVYKLKSAEEILSGAKSAQQNGAQRFGIVTSGVGIKDEAEWKKIYKTVKLLRKETNLEIDASLGCLDKEHALLLKEAGLNKYHHNLETSPEFFPKICTTHSYEERLNTLRVVKEAGLQLCSGGLFGLGESWEDRIDFAFLLRDLDPDTIPLNFLDPIPETPLANIKPLPAQDILRIVAFFRIIFPEKDISVCGGREKNLRDLQSWIFYAGATGAMLGNYLTTSGRSVTEDIQLVQDLGLDLEEDVKISV